MLDMLIKTEIARRQAECQCEIDTVNSAMKDFFAHDIEGDISPLLHRCLVAAMRMACIPDDVRTDYHVLYGSGFSAQLSILVT